MPEAIWETPFWDCFASFDLDDEMVIFDRRSGHTHILDPVASMVLIEIADEPRSTRDLIDLANETFDSDGDIDFAAHIETSLRQLLELELATKRLP